MIKIVFNGAKATVISKEQAGGLNLDYKLKQLLQWVDKKVERNNYYQKWNPADSKRSCYDVGTRSFPTGLLPRVIEFLVEIGEPYELECLYQAEAYSPWKLPEWAWDHQELAVKTAIDFQRCMISSPTGSGKSKTLVWVVKQYPTQKILITVPQIALQKSLVKQLSEFLDEPIGQVGNGKENWQRVTVGIINSLFSHAEGKFKYNLAETEILIGDECHTGSCYSYQTIGEHCPNTFFRLGLSATAYSESGADLLLEGVFGPLALVIPEMEMVDKGVIHKPKGRFIKVPAPVTIYSNAVMKGGKVVYPDKPEQREVYLTAICRNKIRNELIVRVVQKYLQSTTDSQVLILVTEIDEHGLILQKEFADTGLEIPFVHSNTKLLKKKERERIQNAFSNCEMRVLLSSPALNVGVDFPSIGLNINAAAGSGTIGVTQKTGRGIRVDQSKRKTTAFQIDFWDEEPHYYQNQARKRMSHLNKLYPDSSKILTEEELYAEFIGLRQATTASSKH